MSIQVLQNVWCFDLTFQFRRLIGSRGAYRSPDTTLLTTIQVILYFVSYRINLSNNFMTVLSIKLQL